MDCVISEGQTMAQYIGSRPPKGSGLHRYVPTVYKQAGETDGHGWRGKIWIQNKGFAQKYNLGSPIAGNFFQSLDE